MKTKIKNDFFISKMCFSIFFPKKKLSQIYPKNFNFYKRVFMFYIKKMMLKNKK